MSQQERDEPPQQAEHPQERQETGGKYTAAPVRVKVCPFFSELRHLKKDRPDGAFSHFLSLWAGTERGKEEPVDEGGEVEGRGRYAAGRRAVACGGARHLPCVGAFAE